MMINPVKAKLARGELVVGSFVFVPSAALTEIIGLIGFDFVVVDMEHGPVSYEAAEAMVRAAELSGSTPFVRVPHNSRHLILRALDTGAAGVHVPDVSDVEAARSAVESVKYGPKGHRGLANVRAARYGLQGSLADYAQVANDQTMVIVHIEEVKAIQNLDLLLEQEGVDVYYLGPVDLSNSLGIPGQTKDPRVKNLVDDAIQRIVGAGRTAGCIASDLTEAEHYVGLGARYIASHAIRFMDRESKRFIQDLRRTVVPSPAVGTLPGRPV
jgi:4-hydroxy-2-oxoheptanedioate aldolase